MSSEKKTKDLQSIKKGTDKAVRYTETTEVRLLSKEQIEEYNIIDSSFGKKYLNSPFIEQNRRFYLALVTLILAFIIVLFLFGIVCYCLFNGQYGYGVGILAVSLVSTVGLFLKFRKVAN